jgi:hypothetical protein
MESRDRHRWDKLAALANDTSTTDGERQTARRLLCELDARIGGRPADETSITLETAQAWEIALLSKLSEQHGLAPFTRGESVKLTGNPRSIDAALAAFCHLQPQLERVILLSAAGWLAKHFPEKPGPPEETSTLTEEELKLVRAAASTTRPVELVPLALTTQAPLRRLEQKD